MAKYAFGACVGTEWYNSPEWHRSHKRHKSPNWKGWRQMKLPPQRYYTPQEVLKKLDITESALRNLVRTGQLHKVVPPGKKHGVFMKEEVDRYHARWLAFLSTEEPESAEFVKATLDD